ncbi:MAG: DUF3341 domain-containing protein [Bdellovibrionales bacterium]|nr:DUF3341 domain-containing protein [Bdellovibrionales bacterium]
MKGNRVVVGVFEFLDDAIAAVNTAKDQDMEYKVYSPVPNHHLDHATSDVRGPVRFISFTGAVTGLTAGFALAIMCSLDYPLRVSAKAIASVPGFVVIGYECTILFGALATLAALLTFCGVPNLLRKVGYDPRFSRDRFGVLIGCDSSKAEEVKAKMLEIGAEEVEVQDGL